MPPEYVDTRRSAASVSWKRASSSSAIWPASFRCRSRATSTRFSRPVRVSSTAANWPVRLMDSRTSAGCVATSKPSTVAVPASGLSSVERIFTAVVLPAPLEPSRAKMLPALTSKSTPRSTCSSSYDFSRPCTPDRLRASSGASVASGVFAGGTIDGGREPVALAHDPRALRVVPDERLDELRRGPPRRSRESGVPFAAACSNRSARSSNIEAQALPSPRPPKYMQVSLHGIDRRAVALRKLSRARLVLPPASLLADHPGDEHGHLPPSRSCSSCSVRKLQVLQKSSRFSCP